jgi:tetratricopeptide (TPR) repeat protein
MRFHLLTAVWGAEFTERFVRVALRSLMAPGNLVDLAAVHAVVYSIHTTEADAERLRAHPIFREVAKRVDFRFELFSLNQIDPKNPSSHWIIWRRGAAQLRDVDDVLITVAADHLFSRGTLLHWAELFLRGHLAVFASGVQVVLETVEEELERLFPAARPIDLSVKDLHGLMFRHLHPVKISMLRGSPRWMAHPEEHLRALRGHGITQTVLTSHAVAFRPRAVRVNDHFCPVEKLDRVAFEPCRYLSPEPALKHLSLYLQQWQMNESALNRFGEWGNGFFFGANLLESRTTHVYAIDDAIPPPARRRAESGARFFVSQMHASRQIFRVWRCLRDRRRPEAARWLAAAHMHARLRRRLTLRGPTTIFLPAEHVIGRLEPKERLCLLAERGRRLICVVRAHVAAGQHPLKRGVWLARSAAGPIRAADGSRYAAARHGATRIVGGPIRVDDIEIYVVDRPLIPLAVRNATAADRLAAVFRTGRHFAGRAMRLMKRGVLRLLLRHQRAYEAVIALRVALHYRSRTGAATRRVVGDADTARAYDAYRRALAFRARDAIRELYGFYRTVVLQGSGIVAALDARLRLPSEEGDGACALLAKAVEHSPDLGEAWLQLGFARLDASQPDAALEAFSRASRLPSMLGYTHRDADTQIVAAIEQAQLLIDRNCPDNALAVLDAAPLRPPVPWKFFYLRASLLLRIGRTDEAIGAFERCMQSHHFDPVYANMLPRNLTMLEAALRERVSVT